VTVLGIKRSVCCPEGRLHARRVEESHTSVAKAIIFCRAAQVFCAIEIPLARVDTLHIAGGRWITSPDGTRQYLLDDHLHQVADPVYDLLIEIAARAPAAHGHPLTRWRVCLGGRPGRCRRARGTVAGAMPRGRSHAVAGLANRRAQLRLDPTATRHLS
jgi:Protein of unknown function (DUF692)